MRRATKIVPCPLGVAQDAAQIKHLKARHGQRDEDRLDDGAAISNEPEKLLAIERLLAEARSAAFLERTRRESAAKFPLRPCCAPQTLKRTAKATVMAAAIQQASIPDRNENEPSGCPPRNNVSQGQGSPVNSSRNFPSADTILGMKTTPMKSSIMEA